MHISVELNASYVYLAMGSYFERDDVALHGFANFFKKASGEERDHGTKFMEYQVREFAIRLNLLLECSIINIDRIFSQNLRGGTIVLKSIIAPQTQAWESAAEAVEHAIQLEKDVNKVNKPKIF